MTDSIRFPRRRRGTASTLTALLLLAAAAAAGYLAVMAALDRSVTVVDVRSTVDAARTTSWDDTTMLYIGIGVAALGIIVLLAALVPARRGVVELAAPDEVTAAGITRKALRRTLESGVTGIDGISGASASIGKRIVKLDATSTLRHVDGLQDAATSVADRRLGGLQLRRPREVTTRLHQKDS